MKLMALDGNSLTYRAFFALPEDMRTAGGQTTNAVYGFVSMLLTLLREHTPDGVVVVFDRKEKNFRHEVAPEYKAQREKQPDSLYEQLELVRQLLEAMGIATFDAPGFEGDDLIATIARLAREAGDELLIVTGDRDAYQLVSDPHVRVLYNKRGVSDYALYDEAGIRERTGVTPDLYPQYAALRGDPSDNLAGAAGVGEKTAAKLLNTYGSLQELYEHVDEQTPKLRESLHESRDRVLRNVDVMTLRSDAPIEFSREAAVPHPDVAAVGRMFDFLEFTTMRNRFTAAFGHFASADNGPSRADAPASPASASGVMDGAAPAIAMLDVAATGQLAGFVGTASEVVIAVQWTGDPGRSDMACVALAPFDTADTDTADTDTATATVGRVSRVAVIHGSAVGALATEVAALPGLVGHDLRPVLRGMLGAGADVRTLDFDTAIAAYLVDSSLGDYSLDHVAQRIIGESVPAGTTGSDAQDLFSGVDLEAARRRAVDEVTVVARLVDPLRKLLAAEGVDSLYRDIEVPLVGVLARMEHVGIAVDVARLRQIGVDLSAQCAQLTTILHSVAGREFNLNSPTQLRTILFDERGLKGSKKTKQGYSTDAASLEKLRDEWPEFIDPLLRFREVEKLRSTYAEGLLHSVAGDGRIHATFNQTVARTGRLSSDHPNLHNIPVRSEEGRVFREAFVPAAGCEFLVADYNQIELRCIAHLADDPGLIAAFVDGRDVHRSVAARVFDVAESEVSGEQRSRAKMVSYGLAYGMEAYGLAQRLNIAVGEAADILDAFFAAFPRVKQFMSDTVAEATRRGYTETLFGRRRPIPELQSDIRAVRLAGQRMAMNAGIQGLAADIFKVALIRIDERLARDGMNARLVLQVHDEVILEVPGSERETVGNLVVDIMHGAADLRVPLAVNAAWGESWAAAKVA
ncbi:MAG: DNA polymerase I [Ilumatobacteraceae bacterium]